MSGLKDFLNKMKKNPKLRNYIILGLFGVMLMIGARALLDSPKTIEDHGKNYKDETNNIKDESYISGYKNKKDLEKDIEELLSKIENAGKVKVLITYENGGELVAEKDVKQRESTQTEEDGEGGKRKIEENDTESQVVYENIGNNKTPFIKSELYPKIRGVVVVAEGGNDEIVVGKITRALEVLLDLPVHKIQVVK